jgi:hypothetical protein
MKSFILSTCALGYEVAEVGLVASSSKAHYFIYYFHHDSRLPYTRANSRAGATVQPRLELLN